MTLTIFSNHRNQMIRVFLTFLLVAVQWSSFAGEGHSHDPAPAASTSPALPRFTAHSDVFEVVGVLDGADLTFLIDRYDTNEPVLGFKVELESNDLISPIPFDAVSGAYSMPSEAFKNPGTYAITLTITGSNEADLLSGELVVPDPGAVHASDRPVKPWGLWAVLAGALLSLTAVVLWRFRQHKSGRPERQSI